MSNGDEFLQKKSMIIETTLKEMLRNIIESSIFVFMKFIIEYIKRNKFHKFDNC